ncbi:MAG TPA: hypothetical protein VG412_10980 [Acidimicrobiales bacterium]|nr:hypothetical protein [Acidimicrobiales bacterium]
MAKADFAATRRWRTSWIAVERAENYGRYHVIELPIKSAHPS